MKERPIIFSGEMVRAVLDGRKTQTRRAVKNQPCNGWSFQISERGSVQLGRITSSHSKKGRFGAFICREFDKDSGKYESDIINCPYGQPGDRLWARESYGYEIRSLGGTPHEKIVFRASKPDAVRCYNCDGMKKPMKWRPSIHMPRWASRILLEIVSVRVERLKAISDEDAKAEGVRFTDFGMFAPKGVASLDSGKTWHTFEPIQHSGYHVGDVSKPSECHSSARGALAGFWEAINGAGSWDANPWVWVVEFKRINQQAVTA